VPALRRPPAPATVVVGPPATTTILRDLARGTAVPP
jgi:hypothetical protein